MTSKQMGIALLVALITLWGLAGIGWFSSSGPPDGSVLGISQAYAGDPDAMTDDPDAYADEGEDIPGEENPPVNNGREAEEDVPDEDIMEVVAQIAWMLVKIGGAVY